MKETPRRANDYGKELFFMPFWGKRGEYSIISV
jgi:hypothetical protein